MTDYPKLAPIVKKAYKAWEDKVAKEQKEVEAEYLKMKTDKPAADKMLNDFNLRIMADAEKLTEDRLISYLPSAPKTFSLISSLQTLRKKTE